MSTFAGVEIAGKIPESSLFRCHDCGLLFRHPVFSPSEYASLYGKVDATCWQDEPGRMDWEHIETYLRRHARPGARVLDFGCHTGGLLGRLGSRYERIGVEVNAQAAAVARAQTGARIVPSLRELADRERVDFAIAADVVEHFPDPGPVISSLLDVLEPGGELIVTTGDAENFLWRIAGAQWWYCYFPEHVSFISASWLRGWARRTSAPAEVASTWTFRHQRLSVLRFAAQCVLLAGYLCAPGAYIRAAAKVRGALGKGEVAYPPGTGLSRDHVFLVLRRQGSFGNPHAQEH